MDADYQADKQAETGTVIHAGAPLLPNLAPCRKSMHRKNFASLLQYRRRVERDDVMLGFDPEQTRFRDSRKADRRHCPVQNLPLFEGSL